MGLGLALLGILSSTGANALPLTALVGLFGFYSLSNSGGPALGTYVLPAELYPTSLRASGHGLAATMGKVGAAIGAFLLPGRPEGRLFPGHRPVGCASCPAGTCQVPGPSVNYG